MADRPGRKITMARLARRSWRAAPHRPLEARVLRPAGWRALPLPLAVALAVAAAGPSVNLALGGQASADSAQSGNPAANAADGDAGTSWCPDTWTGSLTVDLGRARVLDGIGITLAAGSTSASAAIELAAAPGNWAPVPAATLTALDPPDPMYVPVPPGTRARFARLTVKSGTGAPVCVGEFRLYGPDPASSRMALGADLSFTPQELAAGARFAFRGQPASPVTIMRENGANYVRMRLWVARLPVTATWPATWPWRGRCGRPG